MILSVQLFPDSCKKGLLTAKLHFGTLLVMGAPQRFQLLFDFRRTLATAHHVIVQHVESFGRVRQSLDAGGKESTRSVTTKTMAARQTGETRRKSLAFAQAIGFGKDARLHLAEQLIGKGCGVGLVVAGDQGCRICPVTF